MKLQSNRSTSKREAQLAFTLLEVMIAAGIFFMAIFAILALVTTNIRNARRLQQQPVNPAMVLPDKLEQARTNALQAGSDSGDFGDLFPGYHWHTETEPFGTNDGLMRVDAYITKPDGTVDSENTISTLMFQPNPPQSLKK